MKTPDEEELLRLGDELERRRRDYPHGKHLERLKADINEIAPEHLRRSLENLAFRGADAMSADHDWSKGKDRRGMSIAGGLALVGFVAIAIFVPCPTPFQYLVFRIVISVAGAASAAFLPGEFGISAKGKGLLVRATSALGVFVLIYWLNPPSLASGAAGYSSRCAEVTKTQN